MPGAFTHITLVNKLAEQASLGNLHGLAPDLALALSEQLGFLELGAVSPDYPYLDILGSSSKAWADRIHLGDPVAVLDALIEGAKQLEDADRRTASVWVLGFAAHLGADMVLHPVVEKKVGRYDQGNEKQHRICEMHQDVHIFNARMNLTIGLAEHLNSGIGRCVAAKDPRQLSPIISGIWQQALSDIYPNEAAKEHPEPDAWHRGFIKIIDNVATEGNRLFSSCPPCGAGCRFGLSSP